MKRTELARLARYFGTAAAAIAVSRYGLPAELQGPTADIIAQLAGQCVAYGWSIIRDIKKGA